MDLPGCRSNLSALIWFFFMLKLKINNLADLQDARYCAAFGADFMSFALGRGDDCKMPERAVSEIVEWLEGPRFVFNYGADYEAAAAYLESNAGDPDAPLAEVRFAFDPSAEFLFGDAVLLAVRLPADIDHAVFESWLCRAHTQAAWVELIPEVFDENLLIMLDNVFSEADNCLLNMDACPDDLLSRLKHVPAGVSVRKKVEEDLIHLDYDAFERFAELLEPYRSES